MEVLNPNPGNPNIKPPQLSSVNSSGLVEITYSRRRSQDPSSSSSNLPKNSIEDNPANNSIQSSIPPLTINPNAINQSIINPNPYNPNGNISSVVIPNLYQGSYYGNEMMMDPNRAPSRNSFDMYADQSAYLSMRHPSNSNIQLNNKAGMEYAGMIERDNKWAEVKKYSDYIRRFATEASHMEITKENYYDLYNMAVCLLKSVDSLDPDKLQQRKGSEYDITSQLTMNQLQQQQQQPMNPNDMDMMGVRRSFDFYYNRGSLDGNYLQQNKYPPPNGVSSPDLQSMYYSNGYGVPNPAMLPPGSIYSQNQQMILQQQLLQQQLAQQQAIQQQQIQQQQIQQQQAIQQQQQQQISTSTIPSSTPSSSVKSEKASSTQGVNVGTHSNPKSSTNPNFNNIHLNNPNVNEQYSYDEIPNSSSPSTTPTPTTTSENSSANQDDSVSTTTPDDPTGKKSKRLSSKRRRRTVYSTKRNLHCHMCGVTETPEWRRGPAGDHTLCNACGLHYAKSLKKQRKEREGRKHSIEMLLNVNQNNQNGAAAATSTTTEGSEQDPNNPNGTASNSSTTDEQTQQSENIASSSTSEQNPTNPNSEINAMNDSLNEDEMEDDEEEEDENENEMESEESSNINIATQQNST